MIYTFEGEDIVYTKDIRRKMAEILDMPEGDERSRRAAFFAEGYRKANPNANGNMGAAAGFLGDRFAEACSLFGISHPVFGQEDPRAAGERLAAETAEPQSEPPA